MISHLEDNPVCRNSYMREYLPKRWWQDRYLNDSATLFLDLSVCLQICLNTGSCQRRGEQITSWPDHLRDHPRCFQFYKCHAAIVHHVTRGTMPELVADIGQKLGKRRHNIVRTKKEDGLIGIRGFQSMMDKQMAVKCNNCGLLGPVDVRLEVTKVRGTGPPMCQLCKVDNDREHLTPISLAQRRANLWKANVEGHSDHLAALRAEQDRGYILCPANLVLNEAQWVWDGITGEEVVLVMVPNVKAAVKALENMSSRAWEDWKNLRAVTEATEGSRILHLQDVGALIKAVSVVYRCKLAAFRKHQIDAVAGCNRLAKCQILERSPKKIEASYKRPTFDHVIPPAILQHFPWSDSAIGLRADESEARNSFYGRVKSFIDVRILADKPVQWSQKLKVIIVKSFEKDITATPEGVLTVTCKGGCSPTLCSNEHLAVDEFLEQTMVGLHRLARLPLVLNYLKAKLFSYERTILRPNCSQWDFKLKFDRSTWDIRLVGHVWKKRRVRVNAKLARKLVQSEDGIVKRLLQLPETLETVSLDPYYLRTR